MAPTKRTKPLKAPRRRPEILVQLSDIASRYRTIVALAREQGWKLILQRGSRPPAFKPDGAIIQALPQDDLALHLLEIGCPTVRLGNHVNRDDHLLPAVLPDLYAAGHLAAEHFAKRLYKQVALVSYQAELPGEHFHPLYEGFLKAAEKLKMDCTYHSTKYEGILEDSWAEREKHKEEDFIKLISGLPKPLGLFAVTDGMAVALCKSCAAAGIRVPEDVAVVGYGNKLECELIHVQLSSVDPSDAERCRQAVNLLAQLMDGGEGPTEPIFVPPAQLVDRESTDVLAAADPVVSQALRFMWDRLDQCDLSVEDVVQASGVSHSTLQRKLQNDIGHGIIAELRRKRLERVCELLCKTELTITEIAAQTGFKTKSYLHRVFRTAFQTTPRQYRQQNAQQN